MSEPTVPGATYEDRLRAPEHLVAEIIKSRLVIRAWPAPKHLQASFSLGGELDGPFHKGRSGPGGW
jgi:hypothetical protein